MIQVAAGTRVYLACSPVDLRKGFDGLTAKVPESLGPIPSPAICSRSAASGATI